MINKEKINKPKVAIVGLTSCEGCQFVLLDQGHKFLNWLKSVDVDEFRLIEDSKPKAEKYDLCIIEGNPITKENIALLKELREKSKLLVVLGNCAALGGVWEMKNYQLKQKTIKSVYKSKMKVANPDIKEVDNFVKVDFVIPGCPVNGAEAMEILSCLIKGKMPRLDNTPVCRECQARGYECLLQQGEICFGPVARSGCEAVCLKSKQACWGCRGTFDGAQIDNLMAELKRNHTAESINRTLEVFGLRDTIFVKKNNKKV